MTNNNPPKIAHFIETDIPGGAEQVLLDLCLYTQQNHPDLKPVVLTFGHQWTMERCQKLGIEHLTIPYLKLFKKSVFLPFFTIAFAYWLRKNNIRLLHSHLFGPITGSAPACWLARIPHVGTLHDVYMIQEKPSRIKLIQLANTLGTKLIAVSKNMQTFYQQQAPLPQLPVIYNGIDTDAFRPMERKDHNEPITLSCTGRLIPLKQVDQIIEATLRLLKKYNVKLVILGDGPERQKLERLAAEYPENILFEGQQNTVRDYLWRTDIFVQYSTTEGLSRSIAEAACCGLPCVVSDVGGNPEIVVHNQSGLLVPHNDIDALYQGLEDLISNQERRQQFSLQARQHAIEQFDKDACNESNIALYKKLLSS